ncbi:2412_t:CDS:2, partial [Dentiscutata erythropus]
MTCNNKKKTYANNNSANTSDGEDITWSILEFETERSEQNFKDNRLSETNQLSRNYKDSSSLETKSTSNEDSIPVPIEKPSEATYINIPKLLKIEKPIYNNYQESLHLMITAKYEKSIPEYRKISETEKNEGSFLTACDWAIRWMMRGIINNKYFSTETHEFLEEFVSSLGSSLLELQVQKIIQVQDISSDYTNKASETPSKKPQNSGRSHMLRSNNNPVKKATEAKTE